MLLHDRTTYEEWKVRVKTKLLSQDLWQDVQHTDEPFPGRGRENVMALHAIQASCDSQTFSMIKDITNAREAWKILANKYAGSTDQDAPDDQTNTSPAGLPNYDDQLRENYEKLYNAVQAGNLEEIDRLIARCNCTLPYNIALNEIIPNKGETALHVAVTNGHEHIVQKLMNQMSEEGLAMRDSDGYTALITAAVLGNKTMVDCMLQRKPDLIRFRDSEGNLPVVMALDSRKIDMGRFLFRHPIAERDQVIIRMNDVEKATLITRAIYTETLDIALKLIGHKPSLALALDKYGESPILALASMRHSFPSGNQLGCWKQFIYSLIGTDDNHSNGSMTGSGMYVPSARQSNLQEDQNNESGTAANNLNDNSNGEQRQSNQEDQNNRSLGDDIRLNVSNGEPHQSNQDQEQNNRSEDVICKQLLEMKKIHVQSDKLLSEMCKGISKSTYQELQDGLVYKAFTRAAKNGIFEFVSKIIDKDPRFLWTKDRNKRNIFMLAVLHREEKIFSILHTLNGKTKYLLTSDIDVNENNMLHMAAMVEDSNWVKKIPGAALQMQRELQWFKEVEQIVHPKAKESTNKLDGLTPQQLFTKNHEKLRKKGEQWMKVTAASYIVVTALIITIMFTAAITIPGGNNQNTGFPIFIKKKLFMVFMMCDAFSLCFSSTSMLMFLGILTSSYAEEDFLKYLPMQMKAGLLTLFCSIATMMAAFSVALIIMLYPQHSWIWILINITLACIPVICFLFMHLIPLLKIVVISTCRSGCTLDRKKKR